MLLFSAFDAGYQAGHNIYELFDKLCAIYRGKEIFFPAEEAVACFEKIVYMKPSKMTARNILNAVTFP